MAYLYIMTQSILAETRARVEAYLRTMMYKDSCIGRYNHTWDHLAEFMKANGYEQYSREVGDAFLNAWHDGKDYKQLTHRQKERVRHIDVLSDMTELGKRNASTTCMRIRLTPARRLRTSRSVMRRRSLKCWTRQRERLTGTTLS